MTVEIKKRLSLCAMMEMADMVQRNNEIKEAMFRLFVHLFHTTTSLVVLLSIAKEAFFVKGNISCMKLS
jgi:hypothetical protein